MRTSNRFLWLLALAGSAAVLTACPAKKTIPDAGKQYGDGGIPCVDDTDCPDPTLFFCNTTSGFCQPSCHQKSDCSATTRGQYALPFCNGPLGCQCDEGTCVAALCSADSDCGAPSVCRNGGCATAPVASTVASCQISPDHLSISRGSNATFFVSLWDSSGNAVVLPPGGGITWTANDSAMTLMGSGTGQTAQFSANSASTSTGVKVVAGGANCTSAVTVFDPGTLATGKIEVVVVDELSERPVSGATVVADDANTGAQLDSQTTQADGTAILSVGVLANISVFEANHSYLTVAGYDPTAGGASRFLSMVVRRNPVDLIGGYKGTFTDLPNSPNILAGIAGMSLAGTITDLNISQLLGSSVPTDVVIGTAINKVVNLPVGVFLEFNQTPIKASDDAQGLAGVCTDAFAGGTGAADPKILAGTCGTRSAWALAGDVAISDLPISAFTGGLSNIDYGAVLSQIIPIFKKFNSSVGRDVQFTLNTPVGDGGFDDSQFAHYDHDFQQIPLGFSYALAVPTLPKFNGNYVDGVITLAGVDAPGRGVVPLGIGAGVNTNPQDGQIDVQSIGSTSLPAGEMFMRQAPTHAGLEGQQYGILALGLSLKSLSSSGLATSALYTRVANNVLPFDPTGATPVQLGGPFISFPENAKFNWGPAPVGGIGAPRAFAWSSAPDFTGVNVVRVSFTNAAGHRWTVVADPATTSFTLPTPPSTLEDRVFNDASKAVQSGMLVQMLQLNSQPTGGGTAVSFKNLVELGGTNADRLNDFTTAFSVEDYGRPSLAWKTPAAGSTTVAKGSTVVVTVTHYNVGLPNVANVDGVVQLAFTGGTGVDPSCNTPAMAVQGTSADSTGAVSIPLPTTCVGANMTMSATLLDSPAQHDTTVTSSLTGVTIQ